MHLGEQYDSAPFGRFPNDRYLLLVFSDPKNSPRALQAGENRGRRHLKPAARFKTTPFQIPSRLDAIELIELLALLVPLRRTDRPMVFIETGRIF